MRNFCLFLIILVLAALLYLPFINCAEGAMMLIPDIEMMGICVEETLPPGGELSKVVEEQRKYKPIKIEKWNVGPPIVCDTVVLDALFGGSKGVLVLDTSGDVVISNGRKYRCKMGGNEFGPASHHIVSGKVMIKKR